MKRLSIFCLLLLPGLAFADGQYEINQLCVANGCFEGDSPGFPVVISSPGSYRLTSNIVVGDSWTNIDGIQISASNVSLDLNGFAIEGPVECTGITPTCSTSNAKHGIRITTGSDAFRNIKISNGTIKGFDLNCIDLFAIPFELIDLRISECGRHGILAAFPGRIDRVNVSNNGEAGIFASVSTRISNSFFFNNGNPGVEQGTCIGNVFEANGSAQSGTEEDCFVLLENNACGSNLC